MDRYVVKAWNVAEAPSLGTWLNTEAPAGGTIVDAYQSVYGPKSTRVFIWEVTDSPRRTPHRDQPELMVKPVPQEASARSPIPPPTLEPPVIESAPPRDPRTDPSRPVRPRKGKRLG